MALSDFEKEKLSREMFSFDVIIKDGSFGKSAKWENNKHPENANFMQPVFWYAYENGDKSKIVIQYSLDRQLSKLVFHVILGHSGNFEEQIFQYWNTNI